MRVPRQERLQWFRVYAAPLTILLLAFALQFYHLGARTFHGDEFGSIDEAIHLGRNANSLPYFALLRTWLPLGDGEFWLRSLSALTMVAVIGVTFVWVRKLCDASAAIITCLLLATSPFLMVYGQQVRFYGLALFAAGLSIWACVNLLTLPQSQTFARWLIAGLFALSALLLNALLLFGEGATLFALSRLARRRKIVIVVALFILALLVLAVPGVRQLGFDALAKYTNADVRYVASRGLALSQVAKIPFTFFFFTFGESVYPLTYWLVIPGVLIFGIVFLLGLVKLRSDLPALTFVSITGVAALVLLYLVFDPLSPPSLQGAAPRYLIFLLPLFYLVLAAGTRGKWSQFLIVPLLLVNFGSLAQYWYGDWAYTDDLIDWRAVTQWTGRQMTPDTVLLLDGRSQGQADYYFPSEWNRQNMPSPETAASQGLGNHSRVILFSDDFHAEARQQTTAVMNQLLNRYDQTAAWVQYPLFVYVYDLKPGAPGTSVVDAHGNVHLPAEIYGLEFQDLRLPISLNVNGHIVESMGAFGLPGLGKEMTRTLVLQPSTTTRTIWLISNVIDAHLTAGTPVATLHVIGTDGSTQTIPLRAGFETSAWDSPCQPGACAPAYAWRKRLALVGSESYPGSWQEFDVSTFAAELDLNRPTVIRDLEIDRVASPGKFYVWEIVME